MTAIIPFLRRANAVFDEDALQVMGAAYDSARKALDDLGQPEIVREIMALEIIHAAKAGERDFDVLRGPRLQLLARIAVAAEPSD